MSGVVPLALIAALAGGCATKHIVRPVSSTAADNEKGVFYALPRTVISLEVPVSRVVKQPSDLVKKTAEDPKKLDELVRQVKAKLGIDVLTEPTSPLYKLGDLTIDTRAEPDPQNVYFVEVAGGFLKNRNFSVEITDTGLLSAAASSIEDRSLAFAVTVLQTAASLVGKALPLMLKQPDEWLDHERVINEIRDVRARRLDLISGRATRNVPPPTAEALDRMLRELDRVEEGLLRHFTGDVETKTVTLRVEARPEREHVGILLAVFNFSKDGGLGAVTAPYVTLAVFPPDFGTSPHTQHPVQLLVTWNPPQSDQMFARVATPANDGERSYYYRVPGTTLVQVLHKNNELARRRVAVAQLGKVVSLPASIGGFSSTMKPTFYVDSGALKTLVIEGKALDATAVQGIGAGGGSILDALLARQKQQEAERDELNRLKRQADILDQKRRIKELDQKLRETE